MISKLIRDYKAGWGHSWYRKTFPVSNILEAVFKCKLIIHLIESLFNVFMVCIWSVNLKLLTNVITHVQIQSYTVQSKSVGSTNRLTSARISVRILWKLTTIWQMLLIKQDKANPHIWNEKKISVPHKYLCL